MNRARFARLDLNGDGALTAAELGSVLVAQARARCRGVFAELDRDRDGVISAVDRAAADAERVSQR